MGLWLRVSASGKKQERWKAVFDNYLAAVEWVSESRNIVERQPLVLQVLVQNIDCHTKL